MVDVYELFVLRRVPPDEAVYHLIISPFNPALARTVNVPGPQLVGLPETIVAPPGIGLMVAFTDCLEEEQPVVVFLVAA